MRELNQNELSVLRQLDIPAEDILKNFELYNHEDFVVALGGVLALREGRGQERNEPFTEQGAPTTGSEVTNGVKSIPVGEYNALSEEEKKEYQTNA